MSSPAVASRENHSGPVVLATSLIGVLVAAAGLRWNWEPSEIATVLALIAALVGVLEFASRRRVAALEIAFAQRHDEASARSARSASDAIGKVALYARELDAQYDDAHEELQRLRQLLDDAIDKLVASFCALNDIAREQRTLAQPYLDPRVAPPDQGGAHPDARATLDALVEQFDRHVVDVVTTLQFQDIAAQLVEHMRARIARAQLLSSGLGELVASLESANDDPSAGLSPGDLDHVNRVDRVRRMARASPVATTRITPGDVDLF